MNKNWGVNIMLGHVSKILHKFGRLLMQVVVIACLIIYYGIITAWLIEAESWRSIVMIEIHFRKNWVIQTGSLSRVPYKIKLFLEQSWFHILVIDSSKEKGIKTHLSEDSRLGIGMSKGINMPANIRGNIEFFKQKRVPQCHLINDIFIIRIRLIIHAPTSIYEL